MSTEPLKATLVSNSGETKLIWEFAPFNEDCMKVSIHLSKKGVMDVYFHQVACCKLAISELINGLLSWASLKMSELADSDYRATHQLIAADYTFGNSLEIVIGPPKINRSVGDQRYFEILRKDGFTELRHGFIVDAICTEKFAKAAKEIVDQFVA